ncbi:MAG: virulence RhuM family protein [Flavobacteriaceae bacterium]|nr:virulence RhuM family protein [Flavobacteriaceae bacterium]
MEKEHKKPIIYQAKDGAIELQQDFDNQTFWATQKQISKVFDVNIPAINKHIKNILKGEELDNSTISILETVQKEGKRKVVRKIEHYNLDMMISIGYRVNSKNATKFRIWATKTLKQHITQGYTINQKILEKNKDLFLKTLNDLKILTQNNTNIDTKNVLTLVQSFSNTFFNLESYDKNIFPKSGVIKEIKATGKELQQDLQVLKTELIKKGEATQLFAQEKREGSLVGIFGTVFQSVFGQDAYPTIEEKASHLLYFIVKNHPFNDGNKRSGAFAFIWLLQKANYDYKNKINPETLTTLTLLIAISSPEEKDKMIGLITLLLKN